MSLSDRKIQILQAIINDYIATAEPVGSRTIAKKYNMGISSATIRNEMSDLEDMGYICQPHASSGRIPSDRGYRLYVDQLMQRRELDANDCNFLQNIVARNISHIDYLMEETGKALSMLTNYTTIISEPMFQGTKLKQIRLVPLDSESLLLVIATEGNFIKNHIIKVHPMPDDQNIFAMGMTINQILSERTLEQIDKQTIAVLSQELKEFQGLLPTILVAVENTVHSAESVQVHLSGTNNILAFPEFSDIQKAKSIFQTLEEKDMLITLLGKGSSNDIQILIGDENAVQSMKNCSIITTSYQMGKNTRGAIGILGPTRMDYSQVVAVLSSMVQNIETVLRTIMEEKNDS